MIKPITLPFTNFEKYSTGYKPIDEDHLEILHHLLRIRDNINPQAEVKIVTELLFKHFTFEESIMEEIHYPLIDLHRAVHSEYLIKFQQALILGSDVTVDELIADTLNHFIWHDRLLVRWMIDNEIRSVSTSKVEIPLS